MWMYHEAKKGEGKKGEEQEGFLCYLIIKGGAGPGYTRAMQDFFFRTHHRKSKDG